MPRLSQVWIEHKCSIDQGNASVGLVNNVGEREPARAERDSIVPTQTHGSASQSRGFSDLIRTIGHPVIVLALNVTQRGGGVSRSKLWIEFDRPVEQSQCLAGALPGPLKSRTCSRLSRRSGGCRQRHHPAREWGRNGN